MTVRGKYGAGSRPPELPPTDVVPPTVQVRAVYSLYRRGAIVRTVKSRWVDVRVEP